MFSHFTFKHRLIGVIFIVSLAVIIVPALFDTPTVDTLASKQSPQAPAHAAWQELDKVEYAFTELTQKATAELNPAAVDAPIDSTLTQLAAAPLSAPMPAVITDEVTPAQSLPSDVNERQPAQIAIAQTTEPLTVAATTPAPTQTPAAIPVTPATKPTVVTHTNTSPAKISIPARGSLENPPAESVVIAATEKLITNNAWAVQLGAFSKVANAQALLERLQKNGYKAYVQHMKDTQLTRVLVGAEQEKQQAVALLSELNSAMNLNGIIVKFNPEDAG